MSDPDNKLRKAMRVNDALDQIQELEDSISDVIQCFEGETRLGHLITTNHPIYANKYSFVINTPKSIAVCPECDKLYDTAEDCCAS